MLEHLTIETFSPLYDIPDKIDLAINNVHNYATLSYETIEEVLHATHDRPDVVDPSKSEAAVEGWFLILGYINFIHELLEERTRLSIEKDHPDHAAAIARRKALRLVQPTQDPAA